MLRNNHGFSVVELLAIIIIATTLLFPLVATLANNIEINSRLHLRRSAASIAAGSLYGLDKIDYDDFRTTLDNANANGLYFVEYNQTTCNDTYFHDALGQTLNYFILDDDQALCTKIFDTIWNNLTLDSDHYKVFVYDYYLTQTVIDALVANTTIPIEVRNEIDNITANDATNNELVRMTIWIKYFDDPPQVITFNGLMIRELVE
ncbi:MAG: hypothetical protein K9L74_00700 [Candidatus Izimaplasma sp.]|nr:hypothetical protein [Candidatus Izimaplasma bacterium]